MLRLIILSVTEEDMGKYNLILNRRDDDNMQVREDGRVGKNK